MTIDMVRLAEKAEERGEGICRTCLAPIWNEGGAVGHRKRAEGWSDRVERGGDSLVCFKAVEYRHVPLTGREAAIYDCAYSRGAALGGAATTPATTPATTEAATSATEATTTSATTTSATTTSEAATVSETTAVQTTTEEGL